VLRADGEPQGLMRDHALEITVMLGGAVLLMGVLGLLIRWLRR